MKIFISWSGELSHKVAKVLREWLPCIVQTAEVFLSSEDIAKGDKWESAISGKLAECDYAIVCLTKDNLTAPWIYFEAGAIAKTLDGRIATLLVGVRPSELQGPLSSYQATSLDKDDFFSLLESINKAAESGLETERLRRSFDAMWNDVESGISKAMKSAPAPKESRVYEHRDAVLEEILQLLRRQSSLLSKPEQLLPREYMASITPPSFKPDPSAQMLVLEAASHLSGVTERAKIYLEGPDQQALAELVQGVFRLERFERRVVELNRAGELSPVIRELRALNRTLAELSEPDNRDKDYFTKYLKDTRSSLFGDEPMSSLQDDLFSSTSSLKSGNRKKGNAGKA